MIAALKRMPVALLAVLAVVIPHFIFVLTKWHAIPLHNNMIVGQTDPDTWLRLTLVRDWLLSGDWYSHRVPNTNVPFEPSTSPWTRPLDIVIAFFTWIQPHSVDLSLRLMRASLLLPVLWMGLLVAGMMRVIRLLGPYPSAYIMAVILVGTQVGIWNYFLMGNADHHAPLAALFVWVLVGIFTPHPTLRLITISGILFALQLWISVEAFILIGATYAYYGFCWLKGDREKIVILSWLTTSIALASAAALMIERPTNEWLEPVYDSISIVYVCTLFLCAFCAWMIRLVPAATQGDRLIIAAVSGTLLILGIAVTYPHIIAGPVYGVDPFILKEFLPRITEAQPFYTVPLIQILPFIIVPLSAAIICFAPWICEERSFYPRQICPMLAYFMVVTLILYYSQQRWSYYMIPLSIALTAPLLGALFTPEHPLVAKRWPARLLVGLTANEQMKRRLPVTIALLGMPLMLMFASAAPDLLRNTITAMNVISPPDNNGSEIRGRCYNVARKLIRNGELTRAMGNTPHNFLIQTDLGTELLFFTQQRIVASNYHREGAGIKYVWDADTFTKESELRAHLRRRNIDAILMCPKVKPEENSLLQAYVMGKKLPSWLQKVNYRTPDSSPHDETVEVTPLLVRVTQ